MIRFSWSGRDAPYLERPVVEALGRVTLARYGGTGGKNEDGALVWSGDGWNLAVILDGHAGSESVGAILELFAQSEAQLLPLCTSGSVVELQRELIALLTSETTSRLVAKVRGETACLITYQCGPHVLWLSIGDNTLYLLHPELARHGQYTLTTRNFFEWIGERNSLGGLVPHFSTGIRQLRSGRSTIVLATDGVQEMPGRPFEPPSAFAEAFNADVNPLQRILAQACATSVRDSCTLISWEVENPQPALMPSG